MFSGTQKNFKQPGFLPVALCRDALNLNGSHSCEEGTPFAVWLNNDLHDQLTSPRKLVVTRHQRGMARAQEHTILKLTYSPLLFSHP